MYLQSNQYFEDEKHISCFNCLLHKVTYWNIKNGKSINFFFQTIYIFLFLEEVTDNKSKYILD